MSSEVICERTEELAQELMSMRLARKDSDTVAEFLNKKLLELEEERRQEEEGERGPNESGWGLLPDLILERIFSQLSISERYYASCVCRQWYNAFYFLKTWQSLVMADTTLTRRKYDYGERCYRHILDHHRAQQLIKHVGHLLGSLTLTPKSFPGLFAHCHFMNHVSSYSERDQENPGCPNGCLFKVHSLRFVFNCDISNRSQEQCVIGTGGDILGSIQRMICNLRYLTRLELIDLLLVPEDAHKLLEQAVGVLCSQLRDLTLINLTRVHMGLVHASWFLNLRTLHISPQSLNDEMVTQLANCGQLRQLHLVQNSYGGDAIPVDPRCWFRVNHLFTVHLRTASHEDVDMMWQERANVVSVIYDCPFTKFSENVVITVIDLYSNCLREFGHFGLPKFRSSRKFVNRIDASLLTLCRRCPYLNTLFIRDRISTSTAMLIVSMSPNLRQFHLRRNALLKKIDYAFHYNLHLDFNFAQWITLNAKSYEKTTREISKVLGASWKPLSDRDFKTACRQRPPF